jgi:hypothetical protein
MKYFKYINIGKPENPGNYYFIKPFEIVSTYTAFIDTWKIANKVCKEIDDVSDTSLLQSYSDLAKFGYVSYSKWNSKESFIKVNNENPVLGYHNTLNGSDARSATQYLYKLKSGEKYSVSKKKNRTAKVFMLDTEMTKDDIIMEYWDSVLSQKNGKIQSSSLYKSIYKDAKFRFIGILQYEDNNSKAESNLKKLLFEAKKGLKVYSFFFKTVMKY